MNDEIAQIQSKYFNLANNLPPGFEILSELDFDQVIKEVAKLPMKERLLIRKFGDLITQAEVLKNINSEAYQNKLELLYKCKDAFFYNDLVTLLLFHEFWKNLEIGKLKNLSEVSTLLTDQRFNKIRNAIAHIDFTFGEKKLQLNDRGYIVEMEIQQASNLAGCLSMLAIFLHHGLALKG